MACIPVFVINLDRATERLAALSAQCKELGLAFERVSAVDGRLLTAAEKRVLNPPRFIGGEMTDGEIGCYASHLRVFQIIVERGLPRACVMEDDVNINWRALAWLAPDAPLPAGCGILKIEGLIRPETEALPIFEYAGQKVVFSPQVSYGTAAYIVTLDAARLALRRLAKMESPIDHVLFHYWENDLHVYEVHPFPVWQNSEMISDVHQDRVALFRFRKPKTPLNKLHRYLTKTVAAVRIMFYQLQRYGFRTFQKVPVDTGMKPGWAGSETGNRRGIPSH